jgi:hypothetical protein
MENVLEFCCRVGVACWLVLRSIFEDFEDFEVLLLISLTAGDISRVVVLRVSSLLWRSGQDC